MSHEEIFNAKRTIQNWIGVSYDLPEIYQRFFIQWTLVNLFYTAEFPDLRGDKKKLLKFGQKYSNFFNFVKEKQEVQVLIQKECVGEGKLNSKPSKDVKKATLKLREIYGLSKECEYCREIKKSQCQEVEDTSYNFLPFEALMRIIYQIRCNLFHGEKLDIHNDENNRDKKLIEASCTILDTILRQVIEN